MEKRWRAVVTVVASALAVPFALSATAQAQEMCGQYDVRSVRGGTYLVQNNQWNPQGATQCISVDTASGDFFLTQNTNTGIYMGYPSIVKGQHYGNQSTGSGMPLQAKKIASLPTSWAIETPAVTSAESWNSAIELWFNKTQPPSSGLGQNDGTELMIWLARANFTPGGEYIAEVEIGGVNWKITGARWGSGSPYWQYIAYSVADETNLSGITVDVKRFMNDAVTRSCGGSPCLNNDWWLTSVQAGFEVATGGLVPPPLTSRSFATTISSITTDRIGTDGKPIVNWMDDLQISAVGCPGGGGSASYTITMGGTVVRANVMTATDGMFTATVPSLYDNHGDAVLQTTVRCSGQPDAVTTTDFYVDPSGKVRTVEGAPISQATVTLFRSLHAEGPFVVVTNGSTVMSPTNRRNPDLTSGTGAFGWDVQPGYYKVRAQKAGCVSPTNPSQPYTESAVLTIPPEVRNLDLRLRCPPQGGVRVTVTNDWGDGYCATLTVTNRTSSPWVWNASFPVDGVINQMWNATYTQSGATATARGIDWNRILAPWASTHDVGFCALRGPGAPGIADATVTINSDWGTGYCAAVTVTNHTSQRIDWTATFTAQGTIYNMWNATYTKAGSQVTIKGVTHNRTLQPGQSILDIGFCANR